jgi:hypothetical protein
LKKSSPVAGVTVSIRFSINNNCGFSSVGEGDAGDEFPIGVAKL